MRQFLFRVFYSGNIFQIANSTLFNSIHNSSLGQMRAPRGHMFDLCRTFVELRTDPEKCSLI